MIDIDRIITEFKAASPNAQATALHRLIYSLDSSLVASTLEKSLWRLSGEGFLPAGLHSKVMGTLRPIPNNKFRKN